MTDLTLDLHPLHIPDHEPEATIAERFAAFHAANPHVLVALIRLFDDARAHGVERWGVKAAFEVLRWQGLRTTGEPYVLNNSYTSHYARLICEERPDLAPMLRLRKAGQDAA